MSTETVKTGEPVTVAAVEPGDEIRSFGESGIQAAITNAIAAIPEGHRIAVIGHVDSTGHIRASVIGRLQYGWSFVGTLQHTPRKGFVGEAGVLWSR